MKKYTNVIVADIETTLVQGVHVPVAIGFYDGRRMCTFNSSNQNNLIQNFIEELILNYRKDSLIYFHNFAKFDGYLLIRNIIRLGFKPELIIRDGQIFSLKLTNGNSTFHFKDSFLMIPFSLEKASKLFNIHYVKTKIPLDKLQNWKDNLEEIQIYLSNDLHTLYELVINYNAFIKNNFQEEILYSLTLPSLSQKIFLNHFFSGKFTNLSSNQDEFIRESYLGSIVDIYKPYGKALVILDFNSMYPAIMAKTKFGLGRAKFTDSITDLHKFCKDHVAFVKVKVTCKKELKYPLITIKHHNKNVQPTGKFIQTVYSKEILYCLDNYSDYYSFEFIKATYFEETDYVFKRYVEKLHQLRTKFKMENNEAGNKLVKLMMNSLYGRFGIKVYDNQTKVVDIAEAELLLANRNLNTLPVEVITEELNIIRFSNTNVRKDLLLKQFKSRVDWAAIITAEGRILMQRLKDLVNVLYLDTDSIVIEKKDLAKLTNWIDPDKLGYLKIVGEYTEGIFVSPKVYILKQNENYTIKIKGIKEEDLKLTSLELEKIFKSKIYGKETSLFLNRISNFLRNRLTFSVYSTVTDFKLTLDYHKREKIFTDGTWTDTKPLHLNEQLTLEDNNDIDYYG